MKLKLHHWILIAFLVGLILGIVFEKDHSKLEIQHRKEDKLISQEVSFVKEAHIIVSQGNKIDTIRFSSVKDFLAFFEKSKKDVISVIIGNSIFVDIINITSKKSLIQYIAPLGNLFLRLLSFLALPLVLSSIITGVASLGNIKTLGRIGLRTLSLYLLTTVIAVSLGLLVASIVEPGKKISAETASKISNFEQTSFEEKVKEKRTLDVLDFLVNIVPNNPFKALSNGEMLQIIVFALFLGIGLTYLPPKDSEIVIRFFEGLTKALINLVKIVLYFAPIGVLALIANVVSDFGPSILSTLGFYFLTVLIGLFLHFSIVYSSILILIGKINPVNFIKQVKEALIVAFSTSSSAATLPVTYECVVENLKVPNKIASFTLPIGATINMDGTSLYQAVAAMFIAQFYGLDLALPQVLTILLTATLASVGTAPVPGVGLIMLVMVLQSVGIPEQGIVLIIGVDRILDMLRTVLNVSGDAVVTLAIWKMEKT
ncbi:MAG: dicarboxylate/amino acid:cation symporter [Ignavibacteria bacterium]|nr:dicarboxylate/amino acid:cation symporter [Ignavibacteria bacterium]